MLDSFNDASFASSGTQFDRSYYVDFKQLVVNDADLDKSYNVYASFRSIGSTVGLNGIRTDKVFLLNIDFNKGSNIIQYTPSTRTNKNISHILPVSCSLERGSTTVYTYFDLKDNDQMPTVVNNIRSINTIKLQVIEVNTYVIFAPAVPPLAAATPPALSAPDNSKYVCILTFVEI